MTLTMMTLFSESNGAGTGMFIGLITIIAFFTTIMGSTYYYIRTRNMERMALIEKGVDLSAFYKKPSTGNTALKYGILLIGLAFGLLFGYLLTRINLVEETVAYFSMILLFGGGSLLLPTFLRKKLPSNEQ